MMLMLCFNGTMDQLAAAEGVFWYWHVLRSVDLFMFLDSIGLNVK